MRNSRAKDEEREKQTVNFHKNAEWLTEERDVDDHWF